jgi:hypothetical protein
MPEISNPTFLGFIAALVINFSLLLCLKLVKVMLLLSSNNWKRVPIRDSFLFIEFLKLFQHNLMNSGL